MSYKRIGQGFHLTDPKNDSGASHGRVRAKPYEGKEVNCLITFLVMKVVFNKDYHGTKR